MPGERTFRGLYVVSFKLYQILIVYAGLFGFASSVLVGYSVVFVTFSADEAKLAAGLAILSLIVALLRLARKGLPAAGFHPYRRGHWLAVGLVASLPALLFAVTAAIGALYFSADGVLNQRLFAVTYYATIPIGPLFWTLGFILTFRETSEQNRVLAEDPAVDLEGRLARSLGMTYSICITYAGLIILAAAGLCAYGLYVTGLTHENARVFVAALVLFVIVGAHLAVPGVRKPFVVRPSRFKHLATVVITGCIAPVGSVAIAVALLQDSPDTSFLVETITSISRLALTPFFGPVAALGLIMLWIGSRSAIPHAMAPLKPTADAPTGAMDIRALRLARQNMP